MDKINNDNKKFKVACIMPHSFDHLVKNPKYNLSMENEDELDYKVISKGIDGNYHHKICHALQIAGLEPTFYYFSSRSKHVKEFKHKFGYKIKRIPVTFKKGEYNSFGWDYSHIILRELSNDEIDCIFVLTYLVNCILPLDMYDIISFFCRIKNYPLITRNGGGSVKCLIKNRDFKYRKLVKKLTLNTAEKIIISSSKEYLVLKDELKIPNDKILFLRNPVDLNYFYPIKRETAAEILNKDPNQKYILFVGRIVELKGIQHILNILPKLKKLYPNITLLIVGFGEYENELKKLVRKRKLENNVIFEGMIFEEKLRYYYNLADVLVLPSYAEGLPNVLLEAIACNTSCIATEVGGIPDILSDNVGILVPPKNENELFNAVKSVLDGKFSMNQRKINKILNECSLENYGEELKKVFKNIEK